MFINYGCLADLSFCTSHCSVIIYLFYLFALGKIGIEGPQSVFTYKKMQFDLMLDKRI